MRQHLRTIISLYPPVCSLLTYKTAPEDNHISILQCAHLSPMRLHLRTIISLYSPVCSPEGGELRMRTTNENERILEKLGKNKRTRICPFLPIFCPFSGKKWAITGKKQANEIEPWRNRAKPKVSPNFDSGSPRPGAHFSPKRQHLRTIVSLYPPVCSLFPYETAPVMAETRQTGDEQNQTNPGEFGRNQTNRAKRANWAKPGKKTGIFRQKGGKKRTKLGKNGAKNG